MIRLAVAFLVLLHLEAPAPATAGPGDPFRSERLTRDDARFLQAALTMSGHYNGLIDGDWGGRSARALISATRPVPTEDDTLQALLPLAEDGAGGWAAFNGEAVSLLVPAALLHREDAADDPYLSYATSARDLILRILFGTASDAGDMHRWLAQNTVAEAYHADTPKAYITSGRLADGAFVYLWSRNVNGTFATALVQWEPGQAGRGRLMVASLSTGRVADLYLAPDGYLMRILDEVDASVASAAPVAPRPPEASSSPASAEPQPGDTIATGTGFYVTPTSIVTAAHVVEGCHALRLADGTAVALLSKDADLDLAVLLRPGGNDTDGSGAIWLDLAAMPARLGMSVTAIGYPYAGLFEQGISATGGNVSALKGLDGSETRLLLSAPVQPGNSGGPLIDRSGRVLGVVVAQASEEYVRERSGSTPQNMNVATRLEPLRGFLDTAGVSLPSPGENGAVSDFEDGLPDAIVRSVVRIHCLE